MGSHAVNREMTKSLLFMVDDKARCRYCGALLKMVGEFTHEKNCRLNDGSLDKPVLKIEKPRPVERAEVKAMKAVRPKKARAQAKLSKSAQKAQKVAAASPAQPDPKTESVCQPEASIEGKLTPVERSAKWRRDNPEKAKAYMREYQKKRRASAKESGR